MFIWNRWRSNLGVFQVRFPMRLVFLLRVVLRICGVFRRWVLFEKLWYLIAITFMIFTILLFRDRNPLWHFGPGDYQRTVSNHLNQLAQKMGPNFLLDLEIYSNVHFVMWQWTLKRIIQAILKAGIHGPKCPIGPNVPD